MPLPSADEIILEALRGEVRVRLDQCTPEQQAFFRKIYISGIDELPEEKLKTAVSLLHRTLAKNAADGRT